MINSIRVFNRSSPSQYVHTLFVDSPLPPVGTTFPLYPYPEPRSRPVELKVESHDYFGSRRHNSLKILVNLRCSTSPEDFNYLSKAPDWVCERKHMV